MNASPQSTKPDSAKSAHVFEAGQANFESEVLQGSLTTPVLVDFWATWCGPCKTLGPILEKLAGEYGGAFKLAKIDCDKEQQLAEMFGVRSIPTVVLIRDGQILDGFAGALPESQVREFLSRHNIQPAKKIETPATQNITEESPHAPRETPHAAIARLREAVEAGPDKPELKLELALAQARAGDINAAKGALESLPAQLEHDDRAKALRAYVDLAQALAGTSASGELMARIESNPKDFAARDALGVRLLLGGDPADAMEQFLAILQGDRNWNEGLARKRLLDAFRIVDDEALVAATRRKMSSLLF
ncbi:MAG TPA: thioredoxin [Rhodanobacteraceae bacterium]|nr:thioredoxin [Rhodanobacteraceae bacterium]